MPRRASTHRRSSASARARGRSPSQPCEALIRPNLRRGTTGAEARDSLRESGVVGTEPLELAAVDREDAKITRRPHARSSPPDRRQKSPFPDDRARSILEVPFRRLDHDCPVQDHEQSTAVLAALDEHVAGGERPGGAHGLKAAQVVAVHGSQYLRAAEGDKRCNVLSAL